MKQATIVMMRMKMIAWNWHRCHSIYTIEQVCQAFSQLIYENNIVPTTGEGL